MNLHKEPYDSQILGQPVYKLALRNDVSMKDMEQTVEQIERGVIFCFCSFNLNNSKILETLKFRLVSIRSTYKYHATNSLDYSTSDEVNVTSFNRKDRLKLQDLQALARTIYKESRYCKDELIPSELGQKIYDQWITNSLYDAYAKRSFIAWYNRVPVGICTVKIRGHNGYIDLLGVLPKHQGKKIGKLLLSQAITFLKTQAVSEIFVVTEGENIPANIFYQRNGFVLNDIELVYHKHI